MAEDDRLLPVLKPGDVAERLRIDRQQARRLMATGAIRTLEFGRRGHKFYRTSEHWLDLFLKEGPPPTKAV